MNQLGQDLASMGMNPRNRPGQGNGRGRGQGDRPEAPDATSTTTSKVKQQIGKGKGVLEGFARSNTPVKGQALIDIQAEIETSEGLSAEALSNQKVPRTVEKHIRGYFDQINKGR